MRRNLWMWGGVVTLRGGRDRLRGHAVRHRDERQGGGRDEDVVQGQWPGRARSARAGRNAAGLHAVCEEGAAEGGRGEDRKAESRVDRLAGGRQMAGRLEERRAHRAGRPRQAVLRRPQGARRRQLLRVPSARAAGSRPTARSDRPSTSSARRAASTTRSRKYAYGKIWNADAYAACSNMPRFGHSGILSQQQVKDLVALLMDPDSPVNK